MLRMIGSIITETQQTKPDNLSSELMNSIYYQHQR